MSNVTEIRLVIDLRADRRQQEGLAIILRCLRMAECLLQKVRK